MHVSKWGNSLAIRLPKKVVEELKLAEGDELKVARIGANEVTLSKADSKADFIERWRALQRPAPPGFRWNRDEANER